MDLLLAVCAGVGLAAACGLRVFVPLLVTGLAVHFGHLHPPGGLDWIGSGPALVMLMVATVAEVAAYYVPWLDHVLDTVTSPGAVVAGVLVAAAAMPDLHPAVRWSAALIAGGGPAAVVQAGSVLTRGVSGATTGGLGNPAVSTAEWVMAVLLSILAIVLPVLAALVVVAFLVWAIRKIVRWSRGRGRGRMQPAA
jgi:hypothetical protein